ncbi:MAG TPA: hypothetical protein VF590_25365 [Isosphaeraceae bacterium]
MDGSSRIDVSGKGYLPGRTTGNSTTGGATGWSGGSYGGWGLGERGASNAVYGDYADPDEPGSGSGPNYSSPGGGLARITAGTLQLDGQLLADGPGASGNSGAGGSGGGIAVAVATLRGGGLIRARGGVGGRNPTGGAGGAGGGGRVAV